MFSCSPERNPHKLPTVFMIHAGIKGGGEGGVAFILQDQISLSLKMIYNNLKGAVLFYTTEACSYVEYSGG